MKSYALEKPQSTSVRRKLLATYDYTDESGNRLFQVVRYAPKDFRQRQPDGNGGWTWKISGVRRVPFMLPELIQSVADGMPVYVVEGEKDVLALVAAGFTATCNPGGAGKWLADFAAFFKRASVIVVADKDAVGREHAQKIAANLQPVAATVRVVEVPDANGTTCKDAADFFTAGGVPAEFQAHAMAHPLFSDSSLHGDSIFSSARKTTTSLSTVCSLQYPSVPSVPSVQSADLYRVHTLAEAIAYTLPTDVHQSNPLLFDFARGLKTLELQSGKPFTPSQLRAAFEAWYERAQPFLRTSTKATDDYFVELLDDYKSAKYPLFAQALAQAWAMANAQPLPVEAMQFDDPQKRRLVALCFQLQNLAAESPFFLSARDAAKLLNHESHSTAASWLRAFCVLEIIREVEKGRIMPDGDQRASRYRYINFQPHTSETNSIL